MMSKAHHIQSKRVRLNLIEAGGMIAPVEFNLHGDHWVSPYSTAPWTADDYEDIPDLLRHLRGDFFCLPFGVDESSPYPHGEVANRDWKLESKTNTSLSLTIEPSEVGGRIQKVASLRDDHLALYQEHVFAGIEGDYNFGHHPILQLPEEPECLIRTSPFKFGCVYPEEFADSTIGERCSLQRGARFETLNEVLLAEGGTTSLASYPARDGYDDLVMISADGGQFAWTAVSFPEYVWIALRRVDQFPSTLFWFSNGGRPQEPWSSRHRNRMGIEDVCSYFHGGLSDSREGRLDHLGIPTTQYFSKEQPTILRHIQFVHPIEEQAGLSDLRFIQNEAQVELHFENGSTSAAPLDWEWLLDTEPGA